MTGMAYTILRAGATIGGLMALPEDASADGRAAGLDRLCRRRRRRRRGGRVRQSRRRGPPAPADIPGVGRFAVVGDPQGAALTLFKGASDARAARSRAARPAISAGASCTPSTDEAAFAFYAERFGWTKGDAMDMGPMGVYQLFKAGGDEAIGGADQARGHAGPFWLYYFNVAGIDAAVESVQGSRRADPQRPA